MPCYGGMICSGGCFVMTRFGRFLIAAGLCFTLPAFAALSPGANAPAFSTMAALAGKAQTVSLSATLKNGALVLYFYPAAFTPGCTLEANQFAQAIPEFRKLGASVLGASADPIETLTKFSVTECRKKFAVAVATPDMIKGYGVALNGSPRSDRTSFVISPQGKVIYSYSSPDYRSHVANTLAALKSWHASVAHKDHH
jgi:thioredoxin-dependent peroxiredoxin